MSQSDPKGIEWTARRSGPALSRPHAEYRDAYVRDRARVIHSAAFRRLQAKTQVLGIGEGDFHRTRLTHSMEVAQLSRGIVRFLQSKYSTDATLLRWLPNPNLIETIALAHDLGHPPFGHGGEVALNFSLRDHGGFEGNGQTLRLLSKLEAHTEGFGLDLTRRALLGVLKYPARYSRVAKKTLPNLPATFTQLKSNEWKPPKCYLDAEQDVFDWIVSPFVESDKSTLVTLRKEPSEHEHGKTQFHPFDTGIMELGDDIAYGVHDFEDSLALKLLNMEAWQELENSFDQNWLEDASGYASFAELTSDLFLSTSHKRKNAIGALVNAFIVSVTVTKLGEFEHPLLVHQVSMSELAKTALDSLKNLVNKKVIKSPQVQTLEYRGQQLVMRLFEAFEAEPKRFLKENFIESYESAADELKKYRVLCDYVAGMTDEYATRMYERMFVPRQGNIFDRL